MPTFFHRLTQTVFRRLDHTTSLVGSAIVHCVLLAIMALMVLPTSERSAVGTIVTDFADAQQTPVPVELQPVALVSDAAAASGRQSLDHQELLANIKHDPLDTAPRSDEPIPLEIRPLGQVAGGFAEQVGPAVQIPNSLGGAGNGENGIGTGDGSFFGLDLKGPSVVFVVDASTSMNHPFPEPYNTRFNRVKVELVRTIQKMTENDRFFMIFFNDTAIPMPATKLVEATEENKLAYLNWMAPGRANGQTEPEEALLMALRLRPEVIYFLTDGRFRYQVVQNATYANQNRVTINTIGFGDDVSTKHLKDLATYNGGVYRYLPDTIELNSSSPAAVPDPPASTSSDNSVDSPNTADGQPTD